MDIVIKIKELAVKKNVSLAEIERSTGLSSGSITKWNKSSPSIDKIEKVANYFGVTVDYLIGMNNAPKWAKKEDVLDLKDFLDVNDSNMAYGGERLTEEDKERVKQVLTGLFWKLNKEEKNKND